MIAEHEPDKERLRAGRRVRYRGTSLIRNNPTLGLYSRPVPRALLWS